MRLASVGRFGPRPPSSSGSPHSGKPAALRNDQVAQRPTRVLGASVNGCGELLCLPWCRSVQLGVGQVQASVTPSVIPGERAPLPRINALAHDAAVDVAGAVDRKPTNCGHSSREPSTRACPDGTLSRRYTVCNTECTLRLHRGTPADTNRAGCG
jgi:hypothetical protein